MSLPESAVGAGPLVTSGGLRLTTVWDTAVASTNLGDQIIMEAVREELADIVADDFVFSVAAHERLGSKGRALIRRSDRAFVGGANLLSSHMWFRPLWRLRPWDALLGGKAILMGVGWYQYQRRADAYTRWLLRSVLNRGALHSVRDSQAERMLRSVGIPNVVNTGCPTIWGLTAEFCANLPKQKSANVVTTLNTYMPDPTRDKRLLAQLQESYERVYLWPQTDSDQEYARELGFKVTFVAPSLKAYDDLLRREPDLDYVGLRLHGGIRALRGGRRAIILEIDNRAAEMGRDFGLPTVDQADGDALRRMIREPFATRVTVPHEAILRWKRQFRASKPADAEDR